MTNWKVVRDAGGGVSRCGRQGSPLYCFLDLETRMNLRFLESCHRTLPAFLPSKNEHFPWHGRWDRFAERLLQRINRQLSTGAGSPLQAELTFHLHLIKVSRVTAVKLLIRHRVALLRVCRPSPV